MQRLWRLRSRARTLVTGHWTTNYWVKNNETGDNWSPDKYAPGQSRLDSLREWLENTGILNDRHKLTGDYCMCAEGAIYLACALDPSATDETAERLIHETERRLPVRVDEDYGYEETWGSIPDFNDDSGLPGEKIIRVLFD